MYMEMHGSWKRTSTLARASAARRECGVNLLFRWFLAHSETLLSFHGDSRPDLLCNGPCRLHADLQCVSLKWRHTLRVSEPSAHKQSLEILFAEVPEFTGRKSHGMMERHQTIIGPVDQDPFRRIQVLSYMFPHFPSL